MNYMGKSNFLSRIDKTSKSHRHFEYKPNLQHRDIHPRCCRTKVCVTPNNAVFFKKKK